MVVGFTHNRHTSRSKYLTLPYEIQSIYLVFFYWLWFNLIVLLGFPCTFSSFLHSSSLLYSFFVLYGIVFRIRFYLVYSALRWMGINVEVERERERMGFWMFGVGGKSVQAYCMYVCMWDKVEERGGRTGLLARHR